MIGCVARLSQLLELVPGCWLVCPVHVTEFTDVSMTTQLHINPTDSVGKRFSIPYFRRMASHERGCKEGDRAARSSLLAGPVLVAVLLLRIPSAQAALVYSNDFNGPPGTSYPEWSSSPIAYTNSGSPRSSGT